MGKVVLKKGLKNLLIILIAISIGLALYLANKNQKVEIVQENNCKIDTINVLANNFCGLLPFIYLNNGLKATEDCPLYEDFGIIMNIYYQSNLDNIQKYLKDSSINIIYCAINDLDFDDSKDSSTNQVKFFGICNQILDTSSNNQNTNYNGLIAKKSFLENNYEIAKTLSKALLKANSNLSQDIILEKQTLEKFAKALNTKEFDKLDSLNIKYFTLEEQANLFGLNNLYQGVKCEEIFTKLSRDYQNGSKCSKTLAWCKVCYFEIIDDLYFEYIKEKIAQQEKEEEQIEFIEVPENEGTF